MIAVSLYAKIVLVFVMPDDWIFVDGYKVHTSWLPEKEEEEE